MTPEEQLQTALAYGKVFDKVLETIFSSKPSAESPVRKEGVGSLPRHTSAEDFPSVEVQQAYWEEKERREARELYQHDHPPEGLS